ncbi:MAG: cation transporter [Patescibacteria group bacterium]|jgi:copper chaperone CopZ
MYVQLVPLLNMHCASCTTLVRLTLEEMPGVISAQVDEREARVEFDQTKVRPEQITSAVKALGHA